MDRAHRSPHPRHNELIALRASRAFESFVHLFKGGRVQGQSPWPRSAERGTLLVLHKAQEGVQGGTLAGGSPFSFRRFLRVRRYVGRWSLACPAVRPHFFGACPKKRCRAAKEKRLFYPGGSTIRVSATSRWSGRSSPDLGRGLVRDTERGGGVLVQRGKKLSA